MKNRSMSHVCTAVSFVVLAALLLGDAGALTQIRSISGRTSSAGVRRDGFAHRYMNQSSNRNSVLFASPPESGSDSVKKLLEASGESVAKNDDDMDILDELEAQPFDWRQMQQVGNGAHCKSCGFFQVPKILEQKGNWYLEARRHLHNFSRNLSPFYNTGYGHQHFHHSLGGIDSIFSKHERRARTGMAGRKSWDSGNRFDTRNFSFTSRIHWFEQTRISSLKPQLEDRK